MFTNFSKVEYEQLTVVLCMLYYTIVLCDSQDVYQFLLCLSTQHEVTISCWRSSHFLFHSSWLARVYTSRLHPEWNLIFSAQYWGGQKVLRGPEMRLWFFITVLIPDLPNWSVNEATPSQFTHNCSLLLAQLADWAHLCVVHNTDHITHLLATVGSGNITNIASVLLDFAAPHAQPNLTDWPDAESLKYSLEW